MLYESPCDEPGYYYENYVKNCEDYGYRWDIRNNEYVRIEDDPEEKEDNGDSDWIDDAEIPL